MGSSKGPFPTLTPSASRWVQAAAVVVTLFFGYQLLLAAHTLLQACIDLVTVLVLGSILALVGQPIVNFGMRRLRLPRVLAALLTMFCGIIGTGILLVPIFQQAIVQLRQFIRQVPDLLGRSQHSLGELLTQSGLGKLNIPTPDISQWLNPNLANIALSGASQVFHALVLIFLTLAVCFWLLADNQRLYRGGVSWLPDKARRHAEFFLEAYVSVFGGYWRGQVVLISVVGFLAGMGAWFLGVPYPLLVGLAAGIFEIVPIIGPLLGGGVALMLALSVSPLLALFTLLLFLGIHILEGYFLAPRIHAHFVSLHPLVALLTLYAGVELGGAFGALIAIPTVSLLSVLAHASLSDLQDSRPDLFRADTEASSAVKRRQKILEDFRDRTRNPWDRFWAELNPKKDKSPKKEDDQLKAKK